MMTPSEEDFELELRSLPGVLSVGVDHLDNGEVERVTLFVRGQDPESVRHVALQVASLYYPRAAVAVEDANRAPILAGRGAEPSRVALTRTDFNVHDGVAEVFLGLAGRVGIGRSGSGPLVGAAEATLIALRELGFDVPFFLVAVNTVSAVRGWPVMVTMRSLSDTGDRIGIAQSDSECESAARATLDALNRYLSGPGATSR
jgi:hypothetical protein